MLIGELARRTGVTATTLRFYEDDGLLAAPDRTPAGYRDYVEAAVERVRFVRQAQAAGLTLAQIREIVAIRDRGRPPCAHVERLVEDRLAAVERRLDELERTRAELRALQARVRTLDPAECAEGVVCSAVSAGPAGS